LSGRFVVKIKLIQTWDIGAPRSSSGFDTRDGDWRRAHIWPIPNSFATRSIGAFIDNIIASLEEEASAKESSDGDGEGLDRRVITKNANDTKVYYF
jgi:hypothetical protein